tara:strand:+ start:4271 stop:4492 length:222 start_codon:yes stop_codon:yes gene_type:complete
MKNIIFSILIFAWIVLAYHVFVCSIASFAAWELSYFNFSEWPPGWRFLYSLGFLVSLVVAGAVVNDFLERVKQ